VPQFGELAQPVLEAISRASGDTYAPIDGERLLAELHAMGLDPDPMALAHLLDQLRDGQFIKFQGVGQGDVHAYALISLDVRGRERVEAWPGASGLSAGDVEALLTILDSREDGKPLASAIREVGVAGAAAWFTAWLRRLGVIPGP
jgi:hypothetical protein